MSDESRAWKDQYMLRFPDGMRDRLKEAAAKNQRSMNAEIVARLSETLSDGYFPISDLGVMALLKRFDHGVNLLENLMIAHHRGALEKFIEEEARAGNPLTRSAAVLEIVDRYLAQHGYTADRAQQGDDQVAAGTKRPRRARFEPKRDDPK